MIMAYIGGIAYKLAADYTISEQAANKIASNISVILDAGQPIPQSGEIIEIRDDDVGEVYFWAFAVFPKARNTPALTTSKLTQLRAAMQTAYLLGAW